MSQPNGPGEAGADPYAGFQGRVGRTFAGSEPWWPPRPRPGVAAPNVVIVLVDDVGFSDLGCYGSEIGTPNLDALAGSGSRWTDFHVTPMCSPTRAALLTGVNPHLAGVGHVANSDPGFPGYAGEIAANAATVAELFRDAGWATFAIGKWHLTKDSDQSDAGPHHSWPLQRGFDRFYGFLEGFTNFHHPHRLVEDNHTVQVDRYPNGYYLTEDLTDRAVEMVRQSKASDPAKPFLLYLAHGAAHAPLQAKHADIERHRGAYDAGWDAVRAARHARQIELGVLPEWTPLPPRNAESGDEVPAWDDLPPDEQRLYARYMEIYAAMIDSIDQSVGRLRTELADMGELDNTIFVFTSDNGGSREGEERGTSQYFRSLVSKGAGVDLDDLDADLSRFDLLGGPRTLPHYPRGWAMVSNTPFRLYKTNTHAGGHSVPFLFSWPAGLPGGQDRRQWAYVTDVVPTLLDLAGVAPAGEQSGQGRLPRSGTSLAPALHDPDAVHGHTEQYFELQGNRGYYREGWEIVTRHAPLTPFGEHEWELYHRADDPTQVDDLAAEHPERVAELAAAWEKAARENQVYPLDEGSRLRYVLRPDRLDALRMPVRLTPALHTLERWRSLQLIMWREFTVDIDLDFTKGDSGVLVAHGDQGGGYAVYIADGEVHFAHNGYGHLTELHGGPLAEGTTRIQVRVTPPGGWKWDVALSVDGRPAGGKDGLAMLAPMAPFEGIDVGIDRRSPVSWPLYERHGPFPFTGRLSSVAYTPGPLAPDAGENFIGLLREIGAKYE